jgi:hypothetical protein
MIEIKELLLRIPDMSEEAGRQLAYEVAERLAQAPLPTSNKKDMEEMSLSIQLGNDRTVWSEKIARQIIIQLNSK